MNMEKRFWFTLGVIYVFICDVIVNLPRLIWIRLTLLWVYLKLLALGVLPWEANKEADGG